MIKVGRVMSNLQVIVNEREVTYLQMPDTALLSFQFSNLCLWEAFLLQELHMFWCQKGKGVFTYCKVNIHLPVMFMYTSDVEMEIHISITLIPFHCFCIFPYYYHLHIKCKIFQGQIHVSYYFSLHL